MLLLKLKNLESDKTQLLTLEYFKRTQEQTKQRDHLQQQEIKKSGQALFLKGLQHNNPQGKNWEEEMLV